MQKNQKGTVDEQPKAHSIDRPPMSYANGEERKTPFTHRDFHPGHPVKQGISPHTYTKSSITDYDCLFLRLFTFGRELPPIHILCGSKHLVLSILDRIIGQMQYQYWYESHFCKLKYRLYQEICASQSTFENKFLEIPILLKTILSIP